MTKQSIECLKICPFIVLYNFCLQNRINAGVSTHGPRATCGPRKGFEWPAGLFRNYRYYQLNCYVIYGELTFREIVI